MEKVAKITRAELVTNYREGLGADDKTFPALKGSTVKQREKLALRNQTHVDYGGPSKSNITLTGKFVQALKVKFKGKGRFDVTFQGMHPKYKTVKKRSKAKKAANSDIARGLTKLGYKLYGFPNKARLRIRKNLTKFIRRQKRR